VALDPPTIEPHSVIDPKPLPPLPPQLQSDFPPLPPPEPPLAVPIPVERPPEPPTPSDLGIPPQQPPEPPTTVILEPVNPVNSSNPSPTTPSGRSDNQNSALPTQVNRSDLAVNQSKRLNKTQAIELERLTILVLEITECLAEEQLLINPQGFSIQVAAKLH